MCGICGIIDYGSRTDTKKQVLANMCAAIKHRGPDDEGIYIKGRAGLGHRRLKIIDLSDAGHQPISNEDGKLWLVFNGEIYNYRDLRQELENKGHIFKSNTDSETLIHLYEEYQEDCVKYLRGMFAFAIWDENQQSLLLARDRVGKKPLLYSYANGVFCFASEFLALLESGLIKKEINYDAIDYYLTFGYIPAPLTIYKGVFKLLPANILLLKEGKITTSQYWQLDYQKKIDISEEDAQAEILSRLKEAVKLRLYSDVPLGAFLSGGIDSSTIVALMSEASSRKVKTFSIGFEEKEYSELKYARNIAQKFATEHYEFIVKPKALEVLPLLVERYGEPYADSSCIPTYYVAKTTRDYVTVALNGDGGDELFAGYERYQGMVAAEIYQRLPGLLKAIAGGAARLLPDSINPKNRLRNLKRFIHAVNLNPPERYLRWLGIFENRFKNETLYTEDFKKNINNANPLDYLARYFNNAGRLNIIDRVSFVDVNTTLPNDYLVKVDIAGMANSLEGRSPFLDHKFMEFVVSLPAEYRMKGFIKKYILKKAIAGLVPKENIYRRKMGFGVPVGEWFRDELKGFLSDILLSEKAFSRGYFKAQAIKDMVNLHISKKKDYSLQLWSLLMLELWHRRFID
ncbi:MAG: asparagine synthase (glutamine-hydrolyzing) [Candidatus Omnitrophica bacterium]|nr:asparagine synthase (glutamine-hydrolyzing) [Candidatus Omnitrophota bacterium]